MGLGSPSEPGWHPQEPQRCQGAAGLRGNTWDSDREGKELPRGKACLVQSGWLGRASDPDLWAGFVPEPESWCLGLLGCCVEMLTPPDLSPWCFTGSQGHLVLSLGQKFAGLRIVLRK